MRFKDLSKFMLVCLTMLSVGIANAVVIPVGVSVEAEVGFDDSVSFLTGVTQNDSMGIGAQTTSIVDGVATGSNSISSQLTDPLFIRSNLSAADTDVDFDFVSYFFNVDLVNNLADDVEFFFSFALDQTASASGDDAGILSEVNLTDNLGDSLFSSEFEVYSDDAQVDSESVNFSFLLGAGESLTFDGVVDLTVFTYDISSFSLLTDASLSLDRIVQHSTDVPAPGALSILLSAGLIGFTLRKRKDLKAI